MDKTITYSDTRLHYTVEGVGRPLFLLHGWGCTGDIFNQIKPFLAEHFQVFTVDFAGFGKSEELDGALLFLVNNEAASFITGVVIPVDGGFSSYSGV